MKKFTRVCLATGVALSVALSMAGCVNPGVETTDGKLNLEGVTIDFRGYRDWQTDAEFADFKEGIDKFKEDYPGVDVVTSVGGGFGFDTDLVVAVSAGDAWDLQYAQDSLGVPTAAVQGLVEPLNDVIDWNDSFYDKTYMDLWKLGENYYGVGNKEFSDFMFLWYKRDDFESAGLKTPLEQYKEGTWNYDAMLEAAAALTKFDGNGQPNKVILDKNVLDQYSTQNVIPFIYSNTDGHLELNVDTQEMREYLQFVYDLGFKAKSTNYVAATTIMGPLYTAYFASDKHRSLWDSERREFVPMPTKSGESYTYMHDNYLTVPKGSKNKAAAVLLAKYVCEARTNYMKTQISTLLSQEQLDMYNKLTETFVVKRDKFPGVDELLNFSSANSEVIKVVTEGKPVSTVVDEIKERLQPQVDIYNENYVLK